MRHLAIAFVIGLAMHADAVMAVTVTNLTTNTTLFYDNFEGVSPVSGIPAVDGSGDYDPVAVTGTWSAPGGIEDNPAITQVTDSTTSPDPGAFEGQNYLRIYRDNTLASNDLNAALTASQTTTGDLIRLSMMVYVPNDGVNARGQFMLLGATSDIFSARAWVRPDGAGNVAYVAPGFAVTDTGIDYTPGVWQEWNLEYTVGGSTFDVTVNGITASGLASFSSGNVAYGYFINSNTTAGSVYLDSVVPEPNTVMMMIIGCLGLAAASRMRKS